MSRTYSVAFSRPCINDAVGLTIIVNENSTPISNFQTFETIEELKSFIESGNFKNTIHVQTNKDPLEYMGCFGIWFDKENPKHWDMLASAKIYDYSNLYRSEKWHNIICPNGEIIHYEPKDWDSHENFINSLAGIDVFERNYDVTIQPKLLYKKK